MKKGYHLILNDSPFSKMHIELIMRFVYSLFVFFVFFFSINQSVSAVEKLYIDPTVSFQTMEGFGASDCWTVNYVGKYWPLAEKEKAAKWLFSSKVDKSGNPEGIGLSIWRVNLGAGTLEQGSKSTIKDITRRAESFLDENGNYDWTKQAGQQWFIKKSKQYGCNSYVLFSNSPPVNFTRNGLGYAPNDGISNLKAENYDKFANYLVDVTDYLAKKHQIKIDFISPVNEPQWSWNGDYQEGSPWQNAEIKKIIVALDKSIQNKQLNSKILFSEAAKWDFLYTKKERASDQVYQFFDKKSENYIGNLKSVEPILGVHSYWTDRSNDTLVEVRTKARELAQEYKLKLHQTEWSLLSVPPLSDFPTSYENATYTDIALFMAKIIYADLEYAQVSSWSYWTSMDVEMWGFKNRFNLIRLHTKGDSTGTIAAGGTVSAMKNLWVLGNYSFFVKPGYKRISISDAKNLSGLMGLSFISPDKNQIVTVLTNNAKISNNVALSLPNVFSKRLKSVKTYLTNNSSNLKCSIVSANSNIHLPAQSVTTVVYDFK